MFSTFVREDEFQDRLVMSVEANVHLHSSLNIQNYTFQSTRNSRAINEHHLLHINCTVCCGVTAERIIDFLFLHDDDDASATSGERYRDTGQNCLRPVVQNKSQM